MDVSLDEHKLGTLRWIVLRGPDREAFRALGEHMRPDPWAELTALAEGSAIPFDDRFLPGNAFTVTGDGLVWSIDHLPVASPGGGAARHFVARGLQRSVRTAGEVIEYLRTHPSAGGFVYTIGDRAGRIACVEAVAGRHAHVDAGPEFPAGPLLWHTNHGRYLPGAEPSTGGTSGPRGQTLAALGLPEADPDPAWFLGVLAGSALPEGVRRDPRPGQPATTLCTLVADLTAGEAMIAARDARPVAIPLSDLAEGNPHHQRAFAAAA